MRLFGPLYDRCRAWAAHPHAPWYLGVISAIESIFFPVPTDVMLAPMSLARPAAWWRYALLATLKYGVAPFRVATFYLAEADWDHLDVDEDLLTATVADTAAKIDRAAELLHARPAEEDPAPESRVLGALERVGIHLRRARAS